MRKFLTCFLCFSIFMLGSVSAFASSGEDYVSSDPDTQELIDSSLETIDRQEALLVDTQQTVLRVSASDTSGLQRIILTLLGDYEPIVTDHTYSQGSGYTYHEIAIQPDYSWIATAAIFLVVIYCFFRLIGSIFSGRV